LDNIYSGVILAFTSPLSFLPEDIKFFPWLNNPIRHYKIVSELTRGGYAIAFLALACSPDGTSLTDRMLVLKFPNLDKTGRFSEKEKTIRLRTTDSKTIDEWHLTHVRLKGCEYATHIIDMDSQWLVAEDPKSKQKIVTSCIVTVQEFLEGYSQLSNWLSTNGAFTEAQSEEWRGLHYSRNWSALCGSIAKALANIHSRRVVHGDIWPPNIFISNTASLENISAEHIRFIDFGESTTFFPSGDDLRQADHNYRAPERCGGYFVPTEQLDVYSYGKLALYLAAGGPPVLDKALAGRERRKHIRNFLSDQNARLLNENPDITDIIVRCTSLDPVERPSMVDILTALTPYTRTEPDWERHARDMRRRMLKMARKYHLLFREGKHALRQLIDDRIFSMEGLLDELKSEMVRTEGSRDEMIRVLISLFSQLKNGDSWSSITSPSVWQSSALGLDGRYLSATIHATRRGAYIHRGYLLTAEEYGFEWCLQFARLLRLNNATRKSLFIDALASAVELICQDRPSSENGDADEQRRNAIQFSNLLVSLKTMVANWRLERRVINTHFSTTSETKGLYIGIIPVATKRSASELRVENPASLMRVWNESKKDFDWLLAVTDIRGRDTDSFSNTTPTLKGVRTYMSVMNIPTDRIIHLERTLRDRSINVGNDLDVLSDCALLACDNT
jgi:serine/threonine protein kinase